MNKSLPSSPECEKSILSCLFKNYEETTGTLIEEGFKDSFYLNEINRKMHQALVSLHDKNGKVDLISFEAENKGLVEDNGGLSYLTEIYSHATTLAYLKNHISIVKDHFIRREAIQIASESILKLYDVDLDVMSTIARLNDSMDEIQENDNRSNDTQFNMQEINKKVMKKLQDLTKGVDVGMQTGFRMIDKMTGGLQKNDLTVIGARPSVGKTALGMAILETVCIKNNNASIFFSAEMSAEAVGMRRTSAAANVNLGLFNQQGVNKSQLNGIKNACLESNESPLIVDDQYSITATQIRNKVRLLKSKMDIKLVLIDYLQRLKPENREESINPKLKCKNALIVLKNTARELGVNVCLLSQLNRDAETADWSQLNSAMCADASEIENDADVIMLIGKNPDYEFIGDEGICIREIKITKQRNGATGLIGGVIFRRECAKFEDIPAHRWDELNTFKNKN